MSFEDSSAKSSHVSTGSSSQPSSPLNAGLQVSSQNATSAAGATAFASSSTSHAAPRIRRRNRMITSCLECRRRKLKCDKQHPCTNCVKTKRDCVFLAPALDSASQLKLTEIKEKMGSLERVLEQEVGRNGAWREARRERAQMASSPEDGDPNLHEDDQDLEPTPLSIVDAVYDKGDDDIEDDIADLGFAMGKMRLTDRIGGFLRPKFKEEMDITLAGIPEARNITKEELAPEGLSPAPFGGGKNLTYLNPGPTYLPPSSSMYFGGGKGRSLIDFLPAESAANYIIEQYKKAVHPICKIVHWNSFQKRYESFWNELRSGIEPVGSLQALIFSAMFCGVVSMTEEEAIQRFAATKKELIENFQQGAETALARAQFLRTTKLETMQALVMYLIPLCRDQLSRAHSALVGTAIRLAECMGLHRDGTAYGMAPVEIHVRRMVWYELCLLDIRTCEAHGPRPGIRQSEYDTKFPLNLDDADLEVPETKLEDASRWTDMTCTLIRMECNEMMRLIWEERPKVERKLVSLTSLIGRIENFRRSMQSRLFPLMNDDIPLHRAARLILIILTTRMHIMVLHRYHNSVSSKIPDRLRQIIRSTGLESIEAAINFETHPALAPYRWFAGALQQYQAAFLLLAEAYAHPNSPEADRISRVIDYVYEPPQHLTQKQKGLAILIELRDRMAVYYSSRKLRAPLGMLKRLAETEGLLYMGPGGYNERRGSGTTDSALTAANGNPTQNPDSLKFPHYLDPEGQAHVNAIMGAVGLGQNSTQPNLDWGATSAFQPLSSANSTFNATGGGGGYGVGLGMGGGPWQDYAQGAKVDVPPGSSGTPVGAPTTVSDDVMADIDWTEWDKLFPPPVETNPETREPKPSTTPNAASLYYG